MLIHKNICSSYFFTLLIISIIILTSPSTMFGEDKTIYDPAKGHWVSLGTQCPQGASGPATEPSNSLTFVRINNQYKTVQQYMYVFNLGCHNNPTAAYCKDGSIVPASVFSSPPCLANYITAQCVEFPVSAVLGNDPGWQGGFPIYSRCYYLDGHGWNYLVEAFCTKNLTAYEWQLYNNPDPTSNFGDPGPTCPVTMN
ncbi:MAG: hypothetical protein NTU74_11765 [Deltaproteobacteria bacterium]|nr:hypothetical protein [Deltaproteobacteria bacterium]